ncbi:MAG: GntR family transcriptional regulator [Eubacterium sp.]|nr:GntR family transcriptional regulator [Eubacterium sp.]
MAWELDNTRSIYLQIVEEIERRIMKGIYAPGSRLAPVREFANEAGVNPNTMQKAFAELERSGLVFSVRTSGRFVTEDVERIRKMKFDTAREATEQFIRQMKELGFTTDEIFQIIQEIKEGDSDA